MTSSAAAAITAVIAAVDARGVDRWVGVHSLQKQFNSETTDAWVRGIA
jgi:hypothetical protein